MAGPTTAPPFSGGLVAKMAAVLPGLPALPALPSFNYRLVSEGFLVAVGVTLAALSSLIISFGLNLQKLSLCTPGNEQVTPMRQPRWVAGLVLVVVGSLVDFMAFGLAPQSLLAPLGALSLVWNLFMASYLLNEKYGRTDILAVALIFCGTALTVVFASHVEREFTLEQLKALYHEERMVVYGVVVPMLLALHYSLIYAVDQGLVRGLGMRRALEVIGYAGFAGIAGGQSVLFAKSTVELLKDASHGDDVFKHMETYVIIAMMCGSLLTQITFLNGALKRFDSLLTLPIYQVYWIMSGVVGGLVYFGEFQQFTGSQMSYFILGTLITIAGLVVLTTRDHHNLDPSAVVESAQATYRRVSRADEDEGHDETDMPHSANAQLYPSASTQHRSIGVGTTNTPGRTSTGQGGLEMRDV